MAAVAVLYHLFYRHRAHHPQCGSYMPIQMCIITLVVLYAMHALMPEIKRGSIHCLQSDSIHQHYSSIAAMPGNILPSQYSNICNWQK